MIKFYYNLAPNPTKVALALEEMGLPYELVPVDTPVIEYVHTAAHEETVERIARYIAGIIDDGSTLHIGLGRIPNEALKYLDDRKDLGIHSDVISDTIIPLLEKGILTGRQKSQQRGKIVASFALGTRRLYDLIDRNPLFCPDAQTAAQWADYLDEVRKKIGRAHV